VSTNIAGKTLCIWRREATPLLRRCIIALMDEAHIRGRAAPFRDWRARTAVAAAH
jgi:hypothetical protein